MYKQGTLTPIRKTPNAAVPPEAMLHALQRLTKDPSVFVYVISGRDQAALDMWLGHIEHLGMSAEHGCYIKNPKSEEWINRRLIWSFGKKILMSFTLRAHFKLPRRWTLAGRTTCCLFLNTIPSEHLVHSLSRNRVR